MDMCILRTDEDECDGTPPTRVFAKKKKTQSQRDTRGGHKLLLHHKMIDRGRWKGGGGSLLYTYGGWSSVQGTLGCRTVLFESYDGSERLVLVDTM